MKYYTPNNVYNYVIDYKYTNERNFSSQRFRNDITYYYHTSIYCSFENTLKSAILLYGSIIKFNNIRQTFKKNTYILSISSANYFYLIYFEKTFTRGRI